MTRAGTPPAAAKHYFPVAAPYRMPGPLFELGEAEAGSQHIEVDACYDSFIEAKSGNHGHWCSRGLQAQLEPVITSWLLQTCDTEYPGLLTGTKTLEDAVHKIQEDLVVMHRDEGSLTTGARAAYVNASFPSGWCPQCTTGMTFMRIHAAVPNVDQFGGTGRKQAANSLFSGKPKVRFIWTLVPDNSLDRRRCTRAESMHASRHFSWTDAESLWLRVERQVIAPIDELTSCFLIRVYHYPITDFSDAELGVIRSALTSMPAAVQRYKGLPDNLDQLLSRVTPAPML